MGKLLRRKRRCNISLIWLLETLLLDESHFTVCEETLKMPHWLATHPCVYEQHKLDSED